MVYKYKTTIKKIYIYFLLFTQVIFFFEIFNFLKC